MGKYPRLEGFSLDDFMLPTIPKSPTTTVPRSPSLNEPNPDPQLLKSRSLKRKNMPNPVLPQPPTAPATKNPTNAFQTGRIIQRYGLYSQWCVASKTNEGDTA